MNHTTLFTRYTVLKKIMTMATTSAMIIVGLAPAITPMLAHAEGPAPVISSVTADPASGTVHVGEEFDAYFIEASGANDLVIDGSCTVNNKDVASTLQSLTDGRYKVNYFVAAGDEPRTAGSIPISCSFKNTDGATVSAASFTDGNTTAIDSAVVDGTGTDTGTGDTGTTTDTTGGTGTTTDTTATTTDTTGGTNATSTDTTTTTGGGNGTGTVLYSEDFEGANTPDLPAGWTIGGNTPNWGTYDTGDGAFGKVLYSDYQNYPYLPNADTTATSPTIDLNGQTAAALGLTARCDSEYTNPTSNSDYIALETSSDGVNFHELTRWNEFSMDTDTESDGSSIKTFSGIAIPAQDLTSNFKFRLHWITNADDGGYDGCMVDQIKITNGSDTNVGGADTTAPVITGLPEHSVSTATPFEWFWSANESAQFRSLVDADP
ncbi:MAG: Thermophilic serine proteinase, partial [Candidatus Taylorbacteria bacterium]|nr:Thermophilic serine proteinase [Candidatus Taylorbacteria bacterium]